MPHEAQNTPHLIQDLVTVLQQGADLITALNDCEYQSRPEVFNSSSIGAHYRHHLEHVQLLLDGADEVIDYDRRAREPRVETDVKFALGRTQKLIDRLQALTKVDMKKKVTIVHQSCMEDVKRPDCQSTLGRELLFVLSHAVHHYAMMNIINQVVGKMPCDETFGVMPSTVSYQQSQNS